MKKLQKARFYPIKTRNWEGVGQFTGETDDGLVCFTCDFENRGHKQYWFRESEIDPNKDGKTLPQILEEVEGGAIRRKGWKNKWVAVYAENLKPVHSGIDVDGNYFEASFYLTKGDITAADWVVSDKSSTVN